MTKQAQKNPAEIMEQVVLQGDLSELTPEQRIIYYNHVCQSVGVNPLTKPFDFIKTKVKVKDGGKEFYKEVVTLYANKDCAAQLRQQKKISIYKLEQRIENGCLIVTAYARTPDGREDLDQGAAWIQGMSSENVANAIKRAITQAKRRVTLSICGLGFLDESETDSIPGAIRVEHPELEAVMTEAEAQALTVTYEKTGLDQWNCGRALAMRLLNVWSTLRTMGVEEEVLRSWLPEGIQSRKDLTEKEAQNLIEYLNARLATYQKANLGQWQCDRKLAITLVDLYGRLAAKGIDNETIKMKLPAGAQSFKALTNEQATKAIEDFSHWLKTYDAVVGKGGESNG